MEGHIRTGMALAFSWSIACSHASGGATGPFAPLFTRADVDLTACTAFRDGIPMHTNPDEILAVLGLGPRPRDSRGWSAGEPASADKPSLFHYRVAFHKPIPIGSAWLEFGELRVLKPNAPYPGDPARDDQWVHVAAYPNQSRPHLVALPPGTAARAVLITARSARRTSMQALRFAARRLHNVAPDATAQAESEFTQYSQLGPPHTYRAANITSGSGAWQNTGRDQKERIPRPPVSDVDPSWFVLSWDEPVKLVGLYLRDNFESVRLEAFRGPLGISPVAALEREWRRVGDVVETRDSTGRWLAFEPVETYGVRLVILRTNPSQIARIEAMQAYVNLGDAPAPAPRTREAEGPPFAIRYWLPEDLNVTVAVNDTLGRRVRNLAARAQRRKGENAEAWDLKDERGAFVAPGTYEWKALAWPPLELRYEMTPYPNIEANAPGNAPWLNGASGPGGWLADHTPPSCVTTLGDKVFFGAGCAESGVSFIACTLDGRKLWGIHSFAAWSGPHRMAADGKAVFVENQGWSASGEEGMDRVWAVDIETQRVEEVLMASQTERRQRGIRGMAAGGGRLYLAIDAGSDWLNSAVGIGDVDIENCLPSYPRKKRSGLDYVPDPRDDFVRLFRIKGTPPGNNGGGLTWLEATRGPGRQQHILLALTRPVAIGSIVLPLPKLDEGMSLKLSVLKPDAPYPPDVEEAKHWTPVALPKSPGGWEVVPLPANTQTRALRFTFTKGADDELEAILDARDEAKELRLDAKKGPAETDGPIWSARIEGARLLRRRFSNLFPTAKVRVSSGTVAPDGSWDAQREEPVTEEKPGIYMLLWPQPQKLRGLAIMEIEAKRTEIDAWQGDGPPDIAGKNGWTHLATYTQQRRYFYWPDDKMNGHARYMDGYVDFGAEVTTRGIRLRVVEQWLHREGDRAGLYGIRADRGGLKLDPTRCRIWGVAPLAPLGGEPAPDPLVTRRIEVIDPTAKKVVHEIPFDRPGPLALNPGGELFTIQTSRGFQDPREVSRVVKVDMEGVRHQVVVSDLLRPTSLAFDGGGSLYVFDSAPQRRNVRVYDAAGKFLRTIGVPGGTQVGPWDPMRFGHVASLAVDRAGSLWAVETQYWPKRISQWTTDGRFLREFLGNTSYGGGGVLDPWNKRRLFYGNLEFELDWEKGATRLKNLTWPDGSEAGELPIKIGERTYVVTRPHGPGPTIPVGIVYLHDKEQLRLVAAFGLANYWRALQRNGEVLAHLGKRVLEDHQFIWGDRNGDGEVQLAEISFAPKRIQGISLFNRDLGAQAGTTRFQVKEFLPNGVPVYEAVELPQLEAATKGWMSTLYRLNDGSFFRMGNPEAAFSANGELLWSYKTEGAGGHALNSASPWHPAQVVSEFGWIGHETAPAGALGEFVVLKTNVGSWNLWTSDGLLAGPIFRDIRDPKRLPWAMHEHKRGLRLDDVTAAQEHFSGYFCRTLEDDKFYAVAGHNHASIVEVSGLDKFRRLGGTVTVTPDDVRASHEWERAHAKQLARREAKVLDCFRVLAPIKVDGGLDDWEGVAPTPLVGEDQAKIHGIAHNAWFRMAYDDTHLYLAYEVRGLGPLKNSGNQWDKLFKTGAAVDLFLGTDPDADPARNHAAAGDLRLLMSRMRQTPIAVLYRPVAPVATPQERWEVVSPVWKLSFDLVKIVDAVRLGTSGGGDRYVVEAAVPLGVLGLSLPDGAGVSPSRMKLDWGVLATDEGGSVVLGRHYWANKATSVLSDAPSEAALHPDLWGYVRFFPRTSRGIRMAEPKDLAPGGGGKDDAIKLELEED